ncbi:hypothetical protein NKH49_26395 [Mesorhizobium sp. M1088]|uniref:hypothetical protein n=1 Tax=unclassified Mesorhizobium TaxID=325217 RepID=UPI003337FD56
MSGCAATIVGIGPATSASEFLDGQNFESDPGGDAMSVGLFTTISDLTIPAGIDAITTSGYSMLGMGAAKYVYDPVVDAAYSAANPRTSALSLNGRGFKLCDARVEIEQFGALGDGFANDDGAFAAFNGWALARPTGTAVHLHLGRSKVYGFTNPRWVQKIPYLRVHGHGSRLHNLGLSRQNSVFGLISADVTSYHRGGINLDVDRYRIATTAIADTSVTCLAPADASNFIAGRYLLVASFDQQFAGFPFNARYFEYAKIVSSDPTTGKIILDRELKYAHSQNFPYKASYANGDGRASIYSIDQNGNVFDIDHEYEDLTFSFSNRQTYNCITISGRKVVLRNVTCNWILRTQGEYLETNNCKITVDSGEVDKLITTCLSNCDEFTGLVASGTGVENMIFNRPIFHKGWRLNSKNLTIINPTDRASSAVRSSIQTGVGFCENLNILGGTMTYPPTYARGLTQEGGGYLTLGSRGVAWDGTKKTISVNLVTAPAAARIFASMCFLGQLIRVRQTTGFGLRTFNFGRVTSIVGDGNGICSIIAVNFRKNLIGSERLIIDSEPFKTFMSTNIESSGKTIVRDYVVCPKQSFELRSLQLSGGATMTHVMSGVMTGLRVTVVRAYSGGTDGNNTLTIKPNGSSGAFMVVIDLKTPGTRETTVAYNYGFTGSNGESTGANLSDIYPASFFSDLVLLTSTLAGTADQMPIIDVQLALFDPANRPSG